MGIAEQLEAAAQLVEKGWTQGGTGALDSYGRRVSCHHHTAKQFCVDAALARACGQTGDNYYEARRFLQFVTKSSGNVMWNDTPGRTQQEVVAAVRQAAELARKEAA